MSEHCARRGDSFDSKFRSIRVRHIDERDRWIESPLRFLISHHSAFRLAAIYIYTFKRRRNFRSQIFELNKIIMYLLPPILSLNRARIGNNLISLELWRTRIDQYCLDRARQYLFNRFITYIFIMSTLEFCVVYILFVCVCVCEGFFYPLTLFLSSFVDCYIIYNARIQNANIYIEMYTSIQQCKLS